MRARRVRQSPDSFGTNRSFCGVQERPHVGALEMPLTDTALRSIRPRDRAYKVYDHDGLFLLINPGGSKLWRWCYRVDGKEKLMGLGQYPIVTLAGARTSSRGEQESGRRHRSAASYVHGPAISPRVPLRPMPSRAAALAAEMCVFAEQSVTRSVH